MTEDCPPDTIAYTIQAGDTLFKISREYNTTVDAILQINPELNPRNLQIGSIICIPTLRH